MSAIVKWKEKPLRTRTDTIRGLLSDNEARLKSALGGIIPVGKFIEMAMSAYSRGDGGLQEAHPSSVCQAVMQAAQLGLSIDPMAGEAYLVTRNNKHIGQKWTTLMIGYRGLMKRAWNSGLIDEIVAAVVHKGDEFNHTSGTTQTIHHVKNLEATSRPEIVCSYASARLKQYAVDGTPCGGSHVIHVSPMWEINEAMAASQGDGKYGPWKDNFGAMAQKTAIRRLMKMLPMDEQVQSILAIEDAASQGDHFRPPEMEDGAFVVEQEGPPESLDELKEVTDGSSGEVDPGENPFL